MLTPWYRFTILLLILSFAGCGRNAPHLQKIAAIPATDNCRIAVLPFSDKGDYAQGGATVNKIFSSELIATGKFQVIPEGDILKLYQQLLLYPNQNPNQDQMVMLGGRLAATFFIGGEVDTMYQRKDGTAVDTKLTFTLRLYDGRSGQLLWTTYYRRKGSQYRHIMHLGSINSISELARRMSGEVISLWIEQGIPSCPE